MIEKVTRRNNEVVVVSSELCEFFGYYKQRKVYHVGQSLMLDIIRVYVIDYNPATGLHNAFIKIH